MKRTILAIILTAIATGSWSQNYVALGDSCLKAKNYTSAAKNYDTFLEKIESRSNMIAYKSAIAWSLAGDREKALDAVKKFVANNYLNNYEVFSDQLTKEKSFDFLKNETEWKEILAKVIEKEDLIKKREMIKVDSFVAYQFKLDQNNMLTKLDLKDGKPVDIYQRIKTFNNYAKINRQLVSMQFKLTDSLHTSFLVVLPKDYDHRRKYPLLFFLHGAVQMNTGFPDYSDEQDTTGWNRFYTKYARLNHVIMVYPRGNKEYNWMRPDKGFFMVPSMLTQIKKVFNIDDDRVFISGHSNGATGSFSYSMKEPSPFTGFYGFNTRPRVATGGTYLRNLLNRSFFNVSTDEDYYYPPTGHDSLNKIMKGLGADYQDHRYHGFPHWFPAFNESEEAHRLMFEDLIKRKRNPFKSFIQWECDEVKYGRCDWVAITALDTLSTSAKWQKPINFDINKWVVLDKNDKAVIRDTTLEAFSYDKISGAIKADYISNTFNIATSRVKALRLYISPEMINMQKKVRVLINGKLYFDHKVKFDKDFMVHEFKRTADRSAIWVNYVDIIL